jgi:RHS repeat-associated protein
MLWMFLLAGILPMAAAFEDPTGLNNEGQRYRDLETGEFISRDPLGFVDGPNVYCYVRQNPWSGFDPEGLQGVPVWETREAFAVDAAYRQGGQAVAQQVRDRFAAARKIAIPAVAGALVGTGVTMATGGMAGPVIAEAGLSGAAAAVTTSAISGAAGGGAAQMTSNAIRGKSLTDGAPSAMLAGATLGAAGEVIGQSAQAFKSAFKEASAITPSARVVVETGKTEVFQRVMSNAELEATQKTGFLRAGREGENFFTNSASLDPKRAQQRLGLDGPLREQRIDFKITNDAKVSGPRTAKPGLSTAGGGREFSTTAPTKIEIIRIDQMKK